MKTLKKRRTVSPNSGHTRGGEAKIESGHTFLRFFLEPFPKWLLTQPHDFFKHKKFQKCNNKMLKSTKKFRKVLKRRDFIVAVLQSA